MIKNGKGKREINVHPVVWSRYNLDKFLHYIEWCLRWHGHKQGMVFKYDSKSLNSRHERKQKLYPYAIIKWIICFYQIFHQKPWWRPELFPGLLLCIFIKRKRRKYLKNISFFLKKTYLSTWCNNLKISKSKVLYHRKWSQS